METLLDLDSLSSARQKTPHEYAAPCPACGGHDRFVILPHRPPTGRYFCRQCGASGDGIDYLRTFEGMSYPDACRAFGITPKQYTRQERKAHQKRNMGHSGAYQRRPAQQGNASSCKVVTRVTSDQKELVTPPEAWQTRAADFVAECLDAVGRTREAQSELYGNHRGGRGLYPAGSVEAGIGWNPRPRFESRAAWGLPPQEGSKHPALLVLPKGILIATRRAGGAVVNLTIRRPDTDLAAHPDWKKFHQVAGSTNAPYIVGSRGLPVVLVEAALDAALLHQEAGHLVSAVAFMGATKAPDREAVDFIKAAPLVIACRDNDPAGKKALARWRAFLPCPVVSIPPLDGYKDLTDQHRAACDIFNPDAENMPTLEEWAAEAVSIASEKAPRRAD